MYKFLLVALLASGLSFVSCRSKTAEKETAVTDSTSQASLTKSPYGKTKKGVAIDQYTLRNENGMSVTVISYGGIITSIQAPDKNAVFEDVVLGFDSLSQYENKHPYFGALIGRFGNRIANGEFKLEGKRYTLATNNGPNHLHGGEKGFDKVVWTVNEYPAQEGVAVRLTYLSKDQEEGYPGNLNVEVIYTLTNKNELRVDYRATTDAKTIINLTQHSYFNLSGNTKRGILDHILTLDADQFLPVGKTLIPTGTRQPVLQTPFDFTQATRIGKRIGQQDQQLTYGLGYDHCWILSSPKKDSLPRAALLYDSISGRQLEIFTTEPAIQFYSGNFLDGSLTGKYNTVYAHRYGLCLETQHFPDSPNQSSFPSTVLSPGEVYESHTVFKFSVR